MNTFFILLFLGVLGLLGQIFFSSLFPLAEKLSLYLHSLCLQQIPHQSDYNFFYEALVCGKNLPEGSLKDSFIKSSILHLIVVSGSHLLFLEKMSLSLLRHKALTHFLLLIYAFMALLQAPVLRALVSLYLRHFAQARKWFWSQTQLSLISGILCLLFFPHWSQSYSFILSWCASLALAFISDHQWPSKPLEQGAFIYGFFLFPLSLISHPHPLAIVFNVFITPLVGILLFPFAILGIFLPFFMDFIDLFLSFFLRSLENLSFELPLIRKDFSSNPFSYLPLWIYLFTAHFISHAVFLLRRKDGMFFPQKNPPPSSSSPLSPFSQSKANP